MIFCATPNHPLPSLHTMRYPHGDYSVPALAGALVVVSCSLLGIFIARKSGVGTGYGFGIGLVIGAAIVVGLFAILVYD